MKNVKFVFGFAIFGFLLSIISSFRAVARSFGMRFFIAIGFAVCFGVIAFLIQFFLGSLLESDSFSAEAPVSGGASATSSSQHPVDIVIQDEELPAEENDPQFFVGSNHQMLNSEDLNSVKTAVRKPDEISSQPSAAETIRNENVSSVSSSASPDSASSTSSNSKPVSAGNEGFVPFSLAENAANFSSIESKSVEEVKKEEKMEQATSVPDFKENNANSDNLDVLPDLEEISEIHAAPTRDSGVVEDSDFSESGNISSSSASAEEVTAGKDTELIAKAISTILARD